MTKIKTLIGIFGIIFTGIYIANGEKWFQKFFTRAPFITYKTRSFDFDIENQNFTVQFYEQIKKIEKFHNKNIVFSPYTIQSAGATVFTGVTEDSKTADEMEFQLHLPSHDNFVLSNVYSDFIAKMKTNSMFRWGNRIFIRKNYSVAPTFMDIMTRYYETKVDGIDFNQSSLLAVNTINEWVSKETNNKIKDIVKVEDLNQQTRLLSVSFVYFKSEWFFKFDKEKTKKGEFITEPGKTIDIDMMHGYFEFTTYNLNELNITMGEIYFEDDTFSLTFILPSSPDIGLDEIENKLSKLLLKDLLLSAEGKNETRHIIIPKFSIESDIDIDDILKKLGIRRMYTPEANMTNLLNASEPIHVSKMVSKSVLEINEDGVQEVYVPSRSVETEEKDQNIFRVNQSFIYLIRDASAVIYFMGRFTGQ